MPDDRYAACCTFELSAGDDEGAAGVALDILVCVGAVIDVCIQKMGAR